VVPVFSGTCWDDRIDGIIRDPVFILECSFQFQNRQDSTGILWFTLCGPRNEDRSKLSMTGVLTRSNFWHPGSPSHPIIMADHPEPADAVFASFAFSMVDGPIHNCRSLYSHGQLVH
jgi:hypothetical protein